MKNRIDTSSNAKSEISDNLKLKELEEIDIYISQCNRQ